jgi:hypothetical protein
LKQSKIHPDVNDWAREFWALSKRHSRLTYFSDYPGFKASNPVVSDDGRFIAFQMAKSREAAGVGHGIFVYDIKKARQ